MGFFLLHVYHLHYHRRLGWCVLISNGRGKRTSGGCAAQCMCIGLFVCPAVIQGTTLISPHPPHFLLDLHLLELIRLVLCVCFGWSAAGRVESRMADSADEPGRRTTGGKRRREEGSIRFSLMKHNVLSFNPSAAGRRVLQTGDRQT